MKSTLINMDIQEYWSKLLFKKRKKFSTEFQDLIKLCPVQRNSKTITKLDEDEREQVINYLKRIYSISNLEQLLNVFKDDITFIAKHIRGGNNPYSFLDGPLWGIPTVQNKYRNQRFVSEDVFITKINKNEITNNKGLRLEHVIDRKAIKDYFANCLTKKSPNLQVIKLSKLMTGCVINMNEDKNIGDIRDFEIHNILDKKDIFRKYVKFGEDKIKDIRSQYCSDPTIGLKIKLKETEDIFLVNLESCDTNIEGYNKGEKTQTDIGRSEPTKIMYLKNQKIVTITNEPRDKKNGKKLKIIECINNKDSDLFYSEDLNYNPNVKNKKNWLIPVFDRQLGHYLHCNCHPYNPYEQDETHIKNHVGFIQSIFALGEKIEGRITKDSVKDWLAKLPKVDGQFMTKDEIKEQPCNCLKSDTP
jgi:hypothetical protein